ncbi:MAG: hypothetical protein HYU66_19345 [Armatimonadetes bacterium]|nr:hypothetical protein [Armatimonadota bacterium]
MRDFVLRPYRPADRAAIRDIQTQTVMLGRPLPQPVMDFEHQLDYYLDYYLDQEPEGVMVVVDTRGAVVAYAICAVHAARAAAWQRREALALAWRWLRHWPRYDRFTRRYYRLRLRDSWHVIGETKPAEAHCHFNALPHARGYLLKPLLQHVCAYARAHELRRVYGELAVIDRRRDGRHLRPFGLQTLCSVPHYTLSGLLGQPVWRLTFLMHVDHIHP